MNMKVTYSIFVGNTSIFNSSPLYVSKGCKEEDIERHREATKIKTIEKIKIGNIMCDTWYYSPYPKGFHNIDVLYVCEFCLNFFLSENEK